MDWNKELGLRQWCKRSAPRASDNVVRSNIREEIGRLEPQKPVAASYAAALGRKEGPTVPKVTGVKGPVLPVPKLVVVRQENKEGEEIKRKLMDLVKPSEIGLKVKRMNLIRNGVIIEADSDEGVEKLLSNDEEGWYDSWEAYQEEAGGYSLRRELVAV